MLWFLCTVIAGVLAALNVAGLAAVSWTLIALIALAPMLVTLVMLLVAIIFFASVRSR